MSLRGFVLGGRAAFGLLMAARVYARRRGTDSITIEQAETAIRLTTPIVVELFAPGTPLIPGMVAVAARLAQIVAGLPGVPVEVLPVSERRQYTQLYDRSARVYFAELAAVRCYQRRINAADATTFYTETIEAMNAELRQEFSFDQIYGVYIAHVINATMRAATLGYVCTNPECPSNNPDQPPVAG